MTRLISPLRRNADCRSRHWIKSWLRRRVGKASPCAGRSEIARLIDRRGGLCDIRRYSHDAAPEPRGGDRPRRPRGPRRRLKRRGGAVAGASDRLRRRARQKLDRLWASPRLSGGAAGGPHRRRRRAAHNFAGPGRDPLRRQRRDRAARLRSRLRRSPPPRRDLRDRAVRAEGKLHHRRTRLLPPPSGRGGPASRSPRRAGRR